MNYGQEVSDESQFEEYTIDVITHEVSAVEEKKCPKQLFTSAKVNNAKGAFIIYLEGGYDDFEGGGSLFFPTMI